MQTQMVMKSFHEKIESRATLDALVNSHIQKYEVEGYKIAMTTVHVENDFVFVTIWMGQPAVSIGPPGIIVPVRTAA